MSGQVSPALTFNTWEMTRRFRSISILFMDLSAGEPIKIIPLFKRMLLTLIPHDILYGEWNAISNQECYVCRLDL